MFCGNCGAQLVDDAKFCGTCGKPLDGLPAFQGAAEPPVAAPGSKIPELTPSERISASFRILFSNFWTLVAAVAVPMAIAGIVAVVVAVADPAPKVTKTTDVFGRVTVHINWHQFWNFLEGAAASGLVVGLASTFATATCFVVVGRIYLGQRIAAGAALKETGARFGSILLIILLIGVITGVPALLFAALVFAVAAAGSGQAVAALAVLLGIPLLCAFLWFAVCANLAIPLLMLRGLRGTEAITGAIRLCRRRWWSVFGTLALMGLVLLGAGFAFGLVGSLVGLIIGSATFGTALVRALLLFVTTPLKAALDVVLTVDLRVRKEGLTLDGLGQEIGVGATPEALGFLTRTKKSTAGTTGWV